jgi:hypothetical protein
MTTEHSQNGYLANDKTIIRTYQIPETSPAVSISMREGDVATVLQWVAHRFDAEVEPLEGPIRDDWGYAPRLVRGSTTVLSNHASGTAIDCNATQHPRGVATKKTMTAGKIAGCRAIVHDSGGVIRWGGDYVSAPPDAMHFEINAGTAAVALLAKKIRAGQVTGSWVGFPNARPIATPTQKGSKMQLLVRDDGRTVFLTDMITRRWIANPDQLLRVKGAMAKFGLSTNIYDVAAGSIKAGSYGVLVGPVPPGYEEAS